MIEIISVNEKQQWLDLLSVIDNTDVYFTPGYLKSCGIIMNGAPLLAVFKSQTGKIVIYPFIKRRINDVKDFASLEEEWFDIVSPYGYSGVLTNGSESELKSFYQEFHEYCLNNQIVCEFTRFHPILHTQEHANLHPCMLAEHWNDTVYVNLGRPLADIEKDFKGMNRRNIKKAISNGLVYKIFDLSLDTMTQFNDIYTETMKRVGSSDFYFFPMDYYKCLLEDLKDNLLIPAICDPDGKPIAMGIFFIYHQQYIHYHLGGSLNDALSLRPNNLMFAKTIEWGHANGYKLLHLGGGTGRDDSLFQFKTMFSNDTSPFFTGKAIHNPDKYMELVNMRKELEFDIMDEKYFPQYRVSSKSVQVY